MQEDVEECPLTSKSMCKLIITITLLNVNVALLCEYYENLGTCQSLKKVISMYLEKYYFLPLRLEWAEISDPKIYFGKSMISLD